MSSWIDHDGKDIPISAETRVLVWQGLETEEQANANSFVASAGWWHGEGGEESNWVWNEAEDMDAIIKYKIVQ